MDKILESLKKLRDKKENASLSDVLTELKEMKQILVATLLQVQLSDLKTLTSPKKEVESASIPEKELKKPELGIKEAIEQLDSFTTHKMKGEVKLFLLHRPTEDFEYEKSIRDGNDFETEEGTIWWADYISTEGKQNGANPIVSCWIPESSIESIPNAHDNTGAWGEMGTNPFATKYEIIVKPGKYQIYQELKKAKELKKSDSILRILNKLV